jgi:hypothetical protein
MKKIALTLLLSLISFPSFAQENSLYLDKDLKTNSLNKLQEEKEKYAIVILLKDKSSIVLLTTDSKFYLDKNSDIIKVSVMTYSKYKLLKKGIKV